jgi:Cft2 family RNA processing exonuclease
LPNFLNKTKIKITVKNRVKDIKTSPAKLFAIINRKNIITPAQMVQKEKCSAYNTQCLFGSSNMLKIIEKVIRETGKENPRKKTSRVSFS